MNELSENIKPRGRNLTIFGVITIILGILAMLAPGLTGISIAMLVGVFVIGGGIVRMIWAFQAGSLGRGLLMFAIGGLTLLCGIFLVANPLFASGVLTIILGIYFVVDGIFEITASFQVKPAPGWGWMLFGGIVSLLLGILIWRQFPISGALAIGVFLGIKLILSGLMTLMVGATARSILKDAEEH